MSNLPTRSTKYASQLSRQNYIFAPDHNTPFSWPKISHPNGNCYLVVIDDTDIHTIMTALVLMKFSHLWGLPKRAEWTSEDQQTWDQIDAHLSLLECCIMSGCDISNLGDGLEAIAAALAAQSGDTINCGGGCSGSSGSCGSGGAGSNDDPPSTTDTSDRNEDPPPGFADWDEYDAYKCDVAYWIVSQVQESLNNWYTFSWNNLLGLSAAEVAAVLSSLTVAPVPGARFVAVVGAILAGISLGMSLILDDILAVLAAEFDEFVCALVDAPNEPMAELAFQQVFQDNIGDVSFPYRLVATAVFNLFGAADSLNDLFDENVTINFPGGNDCSSCNPQWWEARIGTVIQWDEDSVELQAIQAGDGKYLICLVPTVVVELNSSMNGGTPTATFSTAVDFDDNRNGSGDGSPWDLKLDGVFNNGPYTCKTLQYRSDTDFAVTYVRTLP